MPNKIKRITKNIHFQLLITLIIGLALRLYNLDEIPSEMWGDTVEGYRFTQKILQGQWPLYFVLGNGPLFFYIAAFCSLLLGLSFYALKFTSVFVGIALIFGVYLFIKEVAGKKIALITAFLIAASKWPLIFSRLGTMNILVPVFVSYIFYFLIRSIKHQKTKDFFLVGLLTGIGLYNYPAFLFVPITLGLLFIDFIFFRRPFLRKNLKKISLGVVTFFVFAAIFSKTFPQLSVTESGSYFGSKLFLTEGTLPPNFTQRLLMNIKNSFLMFHIKGDINFRVNSPNEPQIDIASGIFMLIGIYFLFKKRSLKRNILYILLPIVTLQFPAILVVNFPVEIPSATRTIGILPFLFFIIAVGIYAFSSLLKKSLRLKIILFALSVILIFNLKSVFYNYPKSLPNQNTPFGKIIAHDIDGLVATKVVYLVGCCWGDWGQPEPDAIRFMSKSKRDVVFLTSSNFPKAFDCSDKKIMKEGEKVLYVRPEWTDVQQKIRNCFPNGSEELISKNGYSVVWKYHTDF